MRGLKDALFETEADIYRRKYKMTILMNFYIEGAQTDPDGPISSVPSNARLRHGRKVARHDQDRGDLKTKTLENRDFEDRLKIWYWFRMQTWKW